MAIALTAVACGSDDDNNASDTTQPSEATEPDGTTGATDSTEAPAPSGPSGTIRVGTYLDAMGLDPHTTTQGQPVIQYLQPVYDTLLRRNADFTFGPMLAESWEYIDDENLQLQLNLREGVTFSDGAVLDAEAVRASLERSLASGGGFSPLIAPIETIDVVDAQTVVLNLSIQSPTIELGLSSPAAMIISPDALENPDLDANPVGSGPFTFDADFFVAGSQWGYDARPDYWDPTLQGVERLELTLLTDVEARFNALREGQIDVAAGALTQIADAEADGLTVYRNDVDWLGLILADRDGTLVPALGDKRVRQALNFAVDREAIMSAVFADNGRVTSQIFPSSSPAYVAELEEAYPYDPDRARELLAEAGYADGFEMKTPSVGALNTYVEAIAGYLAEVGVTLNITTLESGFVAAVIGGEYDAPLMSFGMEHPHADTSTLLLPTAPFNPFKVENPEIIALWEEAALQTGDEAAATYQEINRLVHDEAWFLVTGRNDLVWFTNPDVGNFTLYAQQAAPAIYGWTIGG